MPRRNVTDRDALVRVAADLVGERGVAGTRLSDVAATAGVAVGTLYNHFAGKEDLLDAVTQRLEGDFVAAMDAAAPTATPLREAVPALVHAVLGVAARSPSLRVLSERSGRRHPGGGEAPLLRGWIAQRVAGAQRAGEVSDVDPDLVADLGFALLRAAMTRGPSGIRAPDGRAHDGSVASSVASAEPLLVGALLGLLPPS